MSIVRRQMLRFAHDNLPTMPTPRGGSARQFSLQLQKVERLMPLAYAALLQQLFLFLGLFRDR